MNSCPWDKYTRGTTQFCEAHLCSWIESPAIAWAAVTYLFASLFLFKFLFHKKNKNILSFAPYVALVMGIGSFGYHASHTLFFQFVDVLGMFSLGMMIIISSLSHLGKISQNYSKKLFVFFIFLIIEMTAFLYLGGGSAPIILGVLVFIYLILEFISFRKNPYPTYKFFKLSMASFGIALFSLWMEKGSGLCNPQNHYFQWHAVWDSFSAVVYLLLPLHLDQKGKNE